MTVFEGSESTLSHAHPASSESHSRNASTASILGGGIVKEPTTTEASPSRSTNLNTTTSSSTADDLPQPLAPLPELPYSLRTRKLAIVIVWTIILLDSVVLPVGLFYILKYGAGWSDMKNMGISSGIFGFISLVQYVLRLWRLLQKSPQYRPVSAGRWSLDFYQYQFTLGFTLITIVISTAVGPSSLRLLALTPSLLPAQCAPQFLVSCYTYKRHLRTPIRLSSTPAGSVAPPAVFTILEDIVAVDGGGGLSFRTACIARYNASPIFRELMYNLTLFWALGSILCIGVTAALCFATVNTYVAFGLGWCCPFVWAAIWAWITTLWVQRTLKRETETWGVPLR